MKTDRSRFPRAAFAGMLLAGTLAAAQSNQSEGVQLNPNTSPQTIANGGSTGASMPINKIVVTDTPAADPDAPATSEKTKPEKALKVSAPPRKKVLSDRALARKLRGQIVHDDSLSSGGRDVKADAAQGKIYLTGTAETEDEKYRIAAKAAVLVGADNVVNAIKVAPPAAPAAR